MTLHRQAGTTSFGTAYDALEHFDMTPSELLTVLSEQARQTAVKTYKQDVRHQLVTTEVGDIPDSYIKEVGIEGLTGLTTTRLIEFMADTADGDYIVQFEQHSTTPYQLTELVVDNTASASSP